MFDEYLEKIKILNNFTKKDILIDEFSLYQNDKIEIYYAPHNETINKKAKVFIVGITPGWTQTSIAYKVAKDELSLDKDFSEVRRTCKKMSRFAGSMRNNLIMMLDEIELNKKLNIESCSELFGMVDELLHTTSLIPYPVFIKKKNYTGSNPSILGSDILMSYVEKYFYEEVKILNDALIIPLGKAVEEVLWDMIKKRLISREQCLLGFPHPSGANGHRKRIFEEEKEMLKKQVEEYTLK